MSAAAWPDRFHRRIPELYAVLALILTSLVCLITAPFFAPDEANQSLRAIALSHGQIIAQQGPEEAGGQVDTGAIAAMEAMNNIRMAWEKRSADFHNRSWGAVDEPLQRPLNHLRWSRRTAFVGFGNTASYPPALYLPAILGWRLGEALNLTIFNSLRLARFLCALTAIALGWLALRVCACARPVLLPFLLLPSVLFLNASSSQDALLLAVALLAVAFLTRPLAAGRSLTLPELIALTILLALCASARPPYALLAFVLLLPTANLRSTPRRLWLAPTLALTAVLASIAAWRAAVASLGMDVSDEANPADQLVFLRTHPFAASAAILRGTAEAAADLWHRGLYVIGWNDLLAPRPITLTLMVCLIATVAATPRFPLRTTRARLLLLLAVILPLLGLSLAEYIIWTPAAHPTVYGLQPRYWLPVLPFALLLLQAVLPDFTSQPWRNRIALVATVILAGIACTLPAIAAHAFYQDSVAGVLRLNWPR